MKADGDLAAYIHANQRRFIDDVSRLASQKSISATNEGVKECSRLVSSMIKEIGGRSRILQQEGSAPLVYGEVASSRSEKTVLFYNHYDVQPADPLDLWDSPPFRPEVRRGRLYGRGVSDDKGEFVSRLKLIESYIKVYGEPPCNIKFCVEGEEETGSNGLERYVRENSGLFACDAALWEHGGVAGDGRPVVTVGCKGTMDLEITLRTLTRDAHSSNAPILPSAPWRMVRLLDSLKDAEERILIPGWYDDVVEFTDAEAKLIEKQPFDRRLYEESYGARQLLGGSTDGEIKRALYSKPTANISGLSSGYTGEGFMTIVPGEVHCKMDFRLALGQDPKDLLRKLRAHLDKNGFADARITLFDSEPAARTSPDDPWVAAAVRAGSEIYGKKSVVEVCSPGTSPLFVVRDRYRAPIISIGISPPDAALHAPNENIRLDLFEKGMNWMARTVENYVGGS